MGLFNKKIEKVLTIEEEALVKNLRRKRERLQKEFTDMKEDKFGEKERGDKFREYIKLTEEQFKSDAQERRSLKAIKVMFRVGLRLKKWR
jgi:hypothetical protein